MIATEATLPLVQPPAWAALERQLFHVMEEAVHPFLEKYIHPDGRLISAAHPRRGRRLGKDAGIIDGCVHRITVSISN